MKAESDRYHGDAREAKCEIISYKPASRSNIK